MASTPERNIFDLRAVAGFISNFQATESRHARLNREGQMRSGMQEQSLMRAPFDTDFLAGGRTIGDDFRNFGIFGEGPCRGQRNGRSGRSERGERDSGTGCDEYPNCEECTGPTCVNECGCFETEDCLANCPMGQTYTGRLPDDRCKRDSCFDGQSDCMTGYTCAYQCVGAGTPCCEVA